ncbi:MAG TPA: prenyltransferase [Acidimicrobiia bacterium]
MNGVDGILTSAMLDETVDAIAAVQMPDGNIPWTRGGHTDPWNLVEAAMALDLGRRHDDAIRAYEWLRSMQRPAGGWHAYYLGNDVEDPTLDTNVACYVATGVWHHYQCTGDTTFLREYWPVVERAIDYALSNQTGTGEIAWRADDPADGALLTGSSSIHHSLRCAIAIAERLGLDRPDWELSVGALAIAVAHRPDRFLDKSRWAMDWYYPILGGVLRGESARMRVARYWDTFVVPGRGVRCVSDQPWVTAAETCELVMALDAIGETELAGALFEWVQFLRHDDGSYWCGMNFPRARFDRHGEHFTPDQPTWNSAAVVLAAHALGDEGPTAGLFRGEDLPVGLSPDELIQAGVEVAAERGARRGSTER